MQTGEQRHLLHAVVDVLWVERFDYAPEQIKDIHRHAYHQIIYVLDGTGWLLEADNQHSFGSKTAFLIQAHGWHGIRTGAETVKTMDVKFRICDSQLNKQVGKLARCIPDAEIEVKPLLERIHEEAKRKAPYYRDLTCLSIMEILFRLLRQDRARTSAATVYDKVHGTAVEDPACLTVLEYIREHYAEEFTLKDLAGAVGYNQSYLCSSFRKAFDCTLMQYLFQYRIEKAKELMLYSDYSLKEIGYRVGFKTIQHFSRLFHKLEGWTPGQFREREREMIGQGICLDDSFINES